MESLYATLRRRAYADDSDDALLSRFAASGDEGAFAELVRRHGPLVYAAARRRLPDPADAADVFQATFLVLVRKARRLDGRRSLGPWLYRVAALTARNLRRKNARRPDPLPERLRAAARPDPAAAWDLDDALLALPERDRAAVVLCHLLGHSRREAADRLGLPEGTLSTILHRALRKLRVRLDRDPRPLLVVTFAVPAGVATAAGRTAVAVWAAGPGVATLAGGTLRTLASTKLIAGGLLAAGLAVGLAVRPSAAEPTVAVAPANGPSRVHIFVPERADIRWSEFDGGRTLPTLRVAVRTPDDLRPLLDRLRTEAGVQPRRVDLVAEPGTAPDTLLAVARVCTAAGFPSVHYVGPTPAFSETLGTETHDWGRGEVVTAPTPLHLPTAFGLHQSPESRAVALVSRLRGTVTRDDTLPGRPVVGVSLAGTALTDAQLDELADLTHLTALDLTGTAVTPAGLARIRLALPGCTVRP